MNQEGFNDRLKDLKLEDGVEGVEALTMPLDRIWEHFVNPHRKHLHIIVQRPPTGVSEFLVGHRNSDQSTSGSSVSFPVALRLSF